MTRPLALIFYEGLLAGNQLINRLDALEYRTQSVSDLGQLHELAARERPLVVLLELGALADRVCAAIRSLRADPLTAHIPVVAFVASQDPAAAAHATALAQNSGARVVVGEAALLAHLPAILEQALQVE
jgi:CheY-like chemotaxis protein